MNERVPLNEVLSLIRQEVDEKVLQAGERRQAAVWEGKETDYLPLIFGAGNPERDQYPKYDMKEQFFDPEKMLYEQLWGVLGTLRGRSDAAPSIRVNFGTGFLCSVFGLSQQIFPDKMPWLQDHLSKEAILKLTPGDLEPIAEKGLLPEFKRYITFYREKLKGLPVHIYLPDTQGAFDVAHLIYRDDIFTDLYDDAPFISHLLSLTEHVYRNASRLMKEWIGEPMDSGYHGGSLYMSGCGVRSCEDSTTLLSPGLVREQVMPYLRKSVASFGGWVHFCGDGQGLLDPLLSAPEVKGINFGNPERFDWPVTMARIAATGKVYFGGIPRGDKEHLSDYFTRILALLPKKGHLIMAAPLREGEDRADAMILWHRLQDQRFA